MSSHELPFGLVLQETAIVLLFLIYRLLLLRYVFVVSHNKVNTLCGNFYKFCAFLLKWKKQQRKYKTLLRVP